MAITREEVEWVARLARLELTRKEEETFTHQLGKILEYVERLNQVSVEGVEPTSHPIGGLIRLRSDRAENPLPVSKALLNAPNKTEDHFRVPGVMKSQSRKKRSGAY